MNRQPFEVPWRQWAPQLSPLWVRLTRGYRRREIRRKQQIEAINLVDGQRLTDLIRDGHGVLICPNHSTHFDSNCLYLAADRLRTPLHFMTAWQVFAACSRFGQWALQRSGCFSVNREGNDRAAFKQAVEILQHQSYPLVIFPEGDIYHLSDIVMPFREGAAAIALAAARKSERPVTVVPTSIRFHYLEDPTPRLREQLAILEQRLYLHSDTSADLKQRILKLSAAVIALKEIDYLGYTREGERSERLAFLSNSVLSRLEDRYAMAHSGSTPERVKNLRKRLINLIDDASPQDGKPLTETPQVVNALEDMEHLFFVTQLYSYRGDYLAGQPSIERVAETLDKLEEDLLLSTYPTVRGRRAVTIRFGDPIPVSSQRGGREQTTRLTQELQSAVQRLLNEAIAAGGH